MYVIQRLLIPRFTCLNKSQACDLKIYNALFLGFKFLQDFSSIIKGFLPRSVCLFAPFPSIYFSFEFRVCFSSLFSSSFSSLSLSSRAIVLCMSSNFLLRYVSTSRDFFRLTFPFLCLVSRTYISTLKETAICVIVILLFCMSSNELVIPFPIAAI